VANQSYEAFFLNTDNVLQRRYEVLRAVHVDQVPMNEVAVQYQISHGTVRNWVSEFRRCYDAGHRPLFSFNRAWDARLHR
jgi:transposase-like protein